MLLSHRIVPLRWRSSFVNAYGAFDTAHSVVVELSADGVRGLGESAPSPLWHEDAETVSAAYQALEAEDALRRVDPACPAQREAVLDRLSDQPAARAGLEMALLDVAAKLARRPLWSYLGVRPSGPLHTFVTIPMVDNAELAAWIAWVVENGYRAIKVKVGGRGAEDPRRAARRLRSIRESLPTATIRVDVNASLEFDEALEQAACWQEVAVEAVEEPLLATSTDEDYATLREVAGIPMLGDETCPGPATLRQRAGRFDGVVIKQANWGGLTRARQGIDLARQLGLRVTLGCNGESAIGISAAAALAPLADDLDLDSSLLLHDDPFAGVDFSDGAAELLDEPGIGASSRSATKQRTCMVNTFPLAGTIGSVVRDVDVTHVDAALAAELSALLAQRHVLVFPDQTVSPATLQSLTEALGPVRQVSLNEPEFPDHPNLSVLRSDARADRWHTDLTYLGNPNPLTVLLYAEGVAGAGDTMWTNMAAAYQALSARMREYLDGLIAVHTAASNGQPEDQTVHPVVARHPVTGTKSLYVNRHYTSHIVGLPGAESRAILDFLFAHAEQVHFTCRWSWSPGDACVWDNRSTMHIAVNDYPEGVQRVMYRMTTSA